MHLTESGLTARKEGSPLALDTSRAAWRIFGTVCLGKLGYLLALAAALVFCPEMDVARFYSVTAWPPDGGPTFASYFAAWDGAHYLHLAKEVYHAGDESCAFNPLWPLLIRWLAPLTGGDLVVTGLLWANVCSAVAFTLFYGIVASHHGHQAGLFSLAFLLTFPGSLFFQFIYSESLFFLLVMVLWWGQLHDRWHAMALSAFLLPLTRSVGLLAVLPILWHLITRRPVHPWMSVLADRLNTGGQGIKT